MPLSLIERTAIEKARSVGNSDMSIALSDENCLFLCGLIARDLGLKKILNKFPKDFPELFGASIPDTRIFKDLVFQEIIEDLVKTQSDTITYFCCLASLLKGRLKYQNILMRQPFPTAEQIGPRSLLQFGSMSSDGLCSLLVWRKWLYDLDNRSAQETGYIFEPIIAHSIGGTPVSSTKSPIRRHNDKTKGRQVDCIANKKAYEIKMRVTIAASGQGRWGEELDFPKDCSVNGYTPVLIVFDSTPNNKLSELSRIFKEYGGEVYIGKDAWSHLESAAGKTMSTFIEKYVRTPIQTMISDIKKPLLPLTMTRDDDHVVFQVGKDIMRIRRNPLIEAEEEAALPSDIDDSTPGLT